MRASGGVLSLFAVANPLTSYTCKLTGPQAEALRRWLEDRHYKFREVPYARFAAERDKTNLVFYESGKLVVQGKGTQEFIEFVLEPEILKDLSGSSARNFPLVLFAFAAARMLTVP